MHYVPVHKDGWLTAAAAAGCTIGGAAAAAAAATAASCGRCSRCCGRGILACRADSYFKSLNQRNNSLFPARRKSRMLKFLHRTKIATIMHGNQITR